MNNIEPMKKTFKNLEYQLIKLKEISKLDFDINYIIDFLQKKDIDFVNDHIDLTHKYISEHDKIKLTDPRALFIINIEHILNQLIKWYQNMPYIIPYYAIKCNPDNLIVELLAHLGIGFDCASLFEIETVLQHIPKTSTNRIIYANPCKMIPHLIKSAELNVNMVTLDCIEELNKIYKYNPNAELVIRLAVDDSNSLCKFSSKFGCNLTTAYDIMDNAKRLNMKVIGISFHVGSGCESIDSYIQAIQISSNAFDYGNLLGHKMYLLDLGGGFPGYNINDHISFEEIANAINSSIDKYFPNKANYKIIAEPGRYMVASSHTLLLNVIGKKTKYLNDDKYLSLIHI
jgi:ornithine decarboxylase